MELLDQRPRGDDFFRHHAHHARQKSEQEEDGVGAEFRQGDKIAKYGLGALVAGGAALWYVGGRAGTRSATRARFGVRSATARSAVATKWLPSAMNWRR